MHAMQVWMGGVHEMSWMEVVFTQHRQDPLHLGSGGYCVCVFRYGFEEIFSLKIGEPTSTSQTSSCMSKSSGLLVPGSMEYVRCPFLSLPTRPR